MKPSAVAQEKKEKTWLHIKKMGSDYSICLFELPQELGTGSMVRFLLHPHDQLFSDRQQKILTS